MMHSIIFYGLYACIMNEILMEVGHNAFELLLTTIDAR